MAITINQLEFIQGNILWITICLLFLFSSLVILFWKIIGILYHKIKHKKLKPEEKPKKIKPWVINDEGYLEFRGEQK